jgi:hypothetical protein
MIAAHPWFETRGVAALLTMRVSDLILRSPPQAGVSKDEATALENALTTLADLRPDPLELC